MTVRTCPREKELAEALRAGYWPEACDSSLRTHVQSCEHCAERLLLTHSFKAARAEAMAAGTLPHPGILWWRAQLRKRNDALEQVSRPTRWVSRVALLAMMVVVAAVLVWRSDFVGEWLGWFGAMPHSSSFRIESLWATVGNWNSLLLLTCAVSLVVFGAVAVVVVSKEQE